jgi:hypothetical protein
MNIRLEIGFMARKFASVKNSHHCSDIHFISLSGCTKLCHVIKILFVDWPIVLTRKNNKVPTSLQQQSIRRNKPESVAVSKFTMVKISPLT